VFALLLDACRRLLMLVWLLVKHTALLLRWVLHSAWRLVSFSSKRAASVAAAAPAAVARAAGRARVDSLDAAAGSPLPDDDNAAEPLLSDEEEERTATKRKQQLRRRAWQQQQQQQQEQVKDEQEDEYEQQRRPAFVNKVGSFRDWAAAAAPPRADAAAAAERSPLHLRQGPPLSPTVLAVQPNLQQWRQHEVPMRQQAAAAASPAAAVAYDAGGYRFPSSTPPAAAQPKSSPWSQERLVMDVDSRQAVSPPPPPQLSAAVLAASPAAAGQGPVSPLVQQGKILNPVSGKVIMFNKPAYNLLVSQGYTPDLVSGVMVPPGDDAAAAAVQQAGAGSSGAGRAVTPGSQGRQRAGRPRSGAAGTSQ
jgi:hypothetical protein